MDFTYAFRKTRLPQGLSFPLKRSMLDAALSEAGVSRIHSVCYLIRQSGHVVMRAAFCGEGRRVAAPGEAAITVYAVPSSERQAVEASLVSEVLPRMVDWLKALELAGNTRRGTDQLFTAYWQADVPTVEAS